MRAKVAEPVPLTVLVKLVVASSAMVMAPVGVKAPLIVAVVVVVLPKPLLSNVLLPAPATLEEAVKV